MSREINLICSAPSFYDHLEIGVAENWKRFRTNVELVGDMV